MSSESFKFQGKDCASQGKMFPLKKKKTNLSLYCCPWKGDEASAGARRRESCQVNSWRWGTALRQRAFSPIRGKRDRGLRRQSEETAGPVRMARRWCPQLVPQGQHPWGAVRNVGSRVPLPHQRQIPRRLACTACEHWLNWWLVWLLRIAAYLSARDTVGEHGLGARLRKIIGLNL